MELLIELPVDKWINLQNKLREHWPFNVAGFYALDLNIRYPAIRNAFQFKVYCPYGNMNIGFVATSVKGTPDCIIFSFTEDTNSFEEAILKTKLLDWGQRVCIDLVTSKTLKLLKKVIPLLHASDCYIGNVKTYFLDCKAQPFENLRYPDNTFIAPVKSEHIERIDSLWPYRHAASIFYFSTLAQSNLGYGLFSRNNNRLLAWVFLNEYNFLCHLYCEEESRRMGCAEALMRHVINEQLRIGNDLYTYVEDGNKISSRLFDKLGFITIDDGAYLFVQK